MTITPARIAEFEENLRAAILGEGPKTNKNIYEYTLQNGFLPGHARDTLNNMIKNGIIPQQKINLSYDAWAKPTDQIIKVKE